MTDKVKDAWADIDSLSRDYAELTSEIKEADKSVVTVSATEITVRRRYGNNHLKPEREAQAIELFMSGKTLRQIRTETGIASRTLQRIRRGLTLPDCACGSPAGHRGWCKVRFDASPARHKVIGRLTKPVRFDARLLKKWGRMVEESNMAKPGQPGFREGVLLLAAFHHQTQNEAKLERATGFPHEFIVTCAFNLRMNNVWLGGRTWGLDEELDINNDAHTSVMFALWILIASGEVVKIPQPKSQSRA